MDHRESIRSKAVEQYLLGELPEPLRARFEEHFMGCRECAQDLKDCVAFIESTRDILRRNDLGLIRTIS